MGRFVQVVEGVATAFGTTASVRWMEGPPPIANDAAWAEFADATAVELGYESIVPILSSAGEDFAVYQQTIPGLFVFMGTSGTQEWHHPAFTLDEGALPVSVNFFANLAKRALSKLSS
ncbi:putative hydrolase YxeP [compost metagenome]